MALLKITPKTLKTNVWTGTDAWILLMWMRWPITSVLQMQAIE